MPTPEQTLKATERHWHTLLVLCMHKMGVKHIAIGPQDVASMPQGQAIVVQEGRDGDGLLHLDIVDAATAAALQSKFAGGKAQRS